MRYGRAMGRESRAALAAIVMSACGHSPPTTTQTGPGSGSAVDAAPVETGEGGWQWMGKKDQLAAITSTVFNADGSKLAIGTGGGDIFVWDLAAPAGNATKIDVVGAIRTLAFSPTGALAIRSSTRDNDQDAMRVWDPATGAFAWSRVSKPAVGATLFWGPHGEIPVIEDNVGTVLVDADNHQTSRSKAFDKPWAWTHDYQIQVGGSPPHARRLDRTGADITLSDKPIAMAEVSADDKLVVLADAEAKLTVVELATGTVVGSAKDDAMLAALAWSSTGVLATASGRSVRLWDAQLKRVGSLQIGGTTVDVAFRPDGKVLSVARDDGLLELWSVSPPKLLASIVVTKDKRELAFAPDGRCDGTYTNKDPIGWHSGTTTQHSAARWKSHDSPGFLKDLLR